MMMSSSAGAGTTERFASAKTPRANTLRAVTARMRKRKGRIVFLLLGVKGFFRTETQEEIFDLSFDISHLRIQVSKCSQCRTATGIERVQALNVESARTLYTLLTVVSTRYRSRFRIGLLGTG